jgi:hypothetical protein
MLERQRSHCIVSDYFNDQFNSTFSLSKASESGFFGGSNAGVDGVGGVGGVLAMMLADV